jgi:hypothetical protein
MIGGAGDDNWVYSPSNDSWQQIPSMPTPRSGAAAITVDSKIYVIGGTKLIGFAGYEFLNTNEVYDPVENTWSELAPIPTGVTSYASAVVGNKIYVFGGVNASNPGGGRYVTVYYTNLVQIYDTKTNQWTNGTTMPTAMGGMAACTIPSMPTLICVVGGIYLQTNPDGSGDYIWVNWTHIYNPAIGDWFTGESMPTTRAYASIANVNGSLYVLGGQDSNETWVNANEMYTPSDNASLSTLPSWVSPATSPSPNPTLTISPTQQLTPTPTATSPTSTSTSTPSPTPQPTASPPIPECPTWTILPFFALITMVAAVVVAKRKHSVRVFNYFGSAHESRAKRLSQR